MNKLFVIGTVHSEGGACTSSELLKIIRNISPDIIFVEAAPRILPLMLKAVDSFNTPEIKALNNRREK